MFTLLSWSLKKKLTKLVNTLIQEILIYFMLRDKVPILRVLVNNWSTLRVKMFLFKKRYSFPSSLLKFKFQPNQFRIDIEIRKIVQFHKLTSNFNNPLKYGW